MINGSVRLAETAPPLDYPGGGYVEPVSYPALDYPASADYDYPVTAPDTGGSYWESLLGYGKEIGKVFTEAYVKQFLPGEDKGALEYKLAPTPLPERLDNPGLYTPYPRPDTGSRPIIAAPAPVGGLPMPLLIIGGLALLMLMKRR